MTTVPFLGPGFRLDVPSTWMIFASGDAQANFLMPPYDADRASTLAVRLSRVAELITSEAVAESAGNAQVVNYPGFEALYSEILTGDVTRVLQSVRWQPSEGEAVVQHNLFCVAEGHLIFALTATRPEALSPHEAAAWDDEVDAALRTFELQDPLPV